VIDFHCHLDLYPNPQQVRDECLRRGMYLLSVTTAPSAWSGTSALATENPNIRTALGLHPQLAHDRRRELAVFDNFLPETRYVGEIGLDGAPEFRGQWQTQIAVLEHILAKCRDAGGRIMSLHSRRASCAVLDCLERNEGAGTPVLHWFSGSLQDFNRAVKLGCWFSIGPAMLASAKGRDLIVRMPRERVLTESDGPFAQVRGRGIMPWDIEDAISGLAQIWSLSKEAAAQVIRGNFRNLCFKSNGAESTWL
jgi:TatD DNase family protein